MINPVVKVSNLTRLWAIFVFLAALALFMLIKPPSAGAAPIGDAIFPNPSASANYPLYMTIGRGEFNADMAGSVIVSDTPGPVGVIIDEAQWCNDDSKYTYRPLDLPNSTDFALPYFSTNFAVFGVDSSYSINGTLASTSSGFSAQCIGRSLGLNFTFGPAQYNPTTKKYVAVFIGAIGAINPEYGSAVPAAAENSFRIGVAGPGTTKAYPLPSGINGVSQSFFNMSNRNRPTNSYANYDIDIKFPCSVRTSVSVVMQFTDTDNGKYQAANGYPDMTLAVPPLFGATTITGGNGEDSQIFSGTIQPDTQYQLSIGGLSWLNAITYNVKVPLDKLFASDDCSGPSTDPLECTVMNLPTIVSPGQVFNVTATLKNNSGVAIGTGDRNTGYHLGITNAAGQNPPDLPNGGQWQPINAVSNLGQRYDELYLGQNYQRMPLGVGIPAGGQATYTFSVTAPSSPVGNKYIGIRILDRTGGIWFSTSPTCEKIVNVSNQPPSGSISTSASQTNCRIVSGTVTDSDWFAGGFRVHLRFDSSYATNPRPQDAEIFTDLNGNWRWTIPDNFKTEGSRSIWVDALGKNASGAEDTWIAVSNSGSVSVGPCRVAACSAINYSVGVGAYVGVANNQTIDVYQGDMLNFKYTMTNSSPVDGGAAIGGFSSGVVGQYSYGYANDFPPSGTTNAFDLPSSSGIRLTPDSSVSSINPGESAVFSYSKDTAPYATGNYPITMRMAHNGVVWFGGTCSVTVRLRLKPITCSVTTVPESIEPNQIFRTRVTLRNPNIVPVPVSSASYSITPSAVSGNAVTKIINSNTTNFAANDSVPASSGGSDGSMTLESGQIQIPLAGDYTNVWVITYADTSVNCPNGGGPNLPIRYKPYVKFYGNDIMAGGGFGNGCANNNPFNADARGYGLGAMHSTYRGSSSELAVFAVGIIQNILPGSQRDRTAPQALAFANTTPSLIDPANGRFGGGFGSVMCSPDYYSKSTSATTLAGTNVDLSSPTLESGSYTYGSGDGTTTNLKTGSGIPEGRRLVIYINGNAQISGSSGRFGYANVAGNWASFSDIPSLYIIASGNIYIDNDVTTMDGVYVAQPRTMGDSNGQIYSCSHDHTDPISDLSDRSDVGDAAFILNSCNSKLTVNGSFMAEKVHLLRSFGTVLDGKIYESYKDVTSKTAEVFKFSPELYLIEGGGLPPRSTNAKIDSIVSLPPAF